MTDTPTHGTITIVDNSRLEPDPSVAIERLAEALVQLGEVNPLYRVPPATAWCFSQAICAHLRQQGFELIRVREPKTP